jgi:hypothetical protein
MGQGFFDNSQGHFEQLFICNIALFENELRNPEPSGTTLSTALISLRGALDREYSDRRRMLAMYQSRAALYQNLMVEMRRQAVALSERGGQDPASQVNVPSLISNLDQALSEVEEEGNEIANLLAGTLDDE